MARQRSILHLPFRGWSPSARSRLLAPGVNLRGRPPLAPIGRQALWCDQASADCGRPSLSFTIPSKPPPSSNRCRPTRSNRLFSTRRPTPPGPAPGPSTPVSLNALDMLTWNLLLAAFIAAPALAAALPNTFSSSGTQPYTVDKREFQRQAAIRIALAKSRAKRSVRRNAGGLSELAVDDLARRNIEEAYSALGVHRRNFETSTSTLSKRRLPRLRCFPNRVGGQDNADEICRGFYIGKVSYPSIATASCNQVCTITCPAGYTQQSNDRNVFCIKNVEVCDNKVCPQDPNGLSGCSNGACTLTCLTRGYTKSQSGTSCINLGGDPNNCGRERNSCPRSYNGYFPPGCSNGQCSLSCPRGTSPGRVNNLPTCV